MKNVVDINGKPVEVESKNTDEILPMHDNVLTEVIMPSKTAAGLEIPEHWKDNHAQPHARVLAMGPLAAERLPGVKVGDIVIVDGSNGKGCNVRKYVAMFPAECIVAKVITGRDLTVLAS